MLLYIMGQFLSKRNSTTRQDFEEMREVIDDLAGMQIVLSQVTHIILINHHVVYVKQKKC